MSFGSDSPGGSPDGIGGNESGIGSDSGGSDGGGFGGWGNTSVGSLSGNLTGSDSSGLGGVSFGGFDDDGFGDFGDVGFGPEGSSYAGQGFLNSNIAGLSGLSDDISEHLRSLSAVEQQNIFSSVISPNIDQFYGTMGTAGMMVAEKVFNSIANGMVPGLGTLASITGATGWAADKLQDAAFSHAVGQELGIRAPDAAGLMSEVESRGLSGQALIIATMAAASKRGDDMSIWDDITGKSAASASTGAAQTQAFYQQQALDYLKQREHTPLEISGGALQQLGGLYGLPGGVGNQQTFIDQARQSPLYGAISGARQEGEEGIMRNAGMTGGLRSGNVQEALYDYNTQLENKALLGAYGEQLGGLQFLAGQQPGGQANIANMMSGIGGTLAAGQIADAQAGQQGTANLLGLAGSAYQAAGGASGIWETGKDVFNEVSSWF